MRRAGRRDSDFFLIMGRPRWNFYFTLQYRNSWTQGFFVPGANDGKTPGQRIRDGWVRVNRLWLKLGLTDLYRSV